MDLAMLEKQHIKHLATVTSREIKGKFGEAMKACTLDYASPSEPHLISLLRTDPMLYISVCPLV